MTTDPSHLAAARELVKKWLASDEFPQEEWDRDLVHITDLKPLTTAVAEALAAKDAAVADALRMAQEALEYIANPRSGDTRNDLRATAQDALDALRAREGK